MRKLLLILALFMLFGCQMVTIPPKVDLVRRQVTVLPLTGVPNAPGLEAQLQAKFINKLSSIEGIRIIEPALLTESLSKQVIIISPEKPEQLTDLVKLFGSDLIFSGGITSYYETLRWNEPVRSSRLFRPKEKYWEISQEIMISLSGILRLIDSRDGRTVWSVSERADYKGEVCKLEVPWPGDSPNPPPPEVIYRLFFGKSKVYPDKTTAALLEELLLKPCASLESPYQTHRRTVEFAREMAINYLLDRLTKDLFVRKELR